MIVHNSNRNSSLKKKLSLYSVAAGAGALAGGTAFAAPVDTGIFVEVSVGPGGFESELIDVNDDGIENFALEVTNNSFSYCGSVRLNGQSSQDGVLDDPDIDDYSSYAALIGEGDSIDSSGDFGGFSILFGDCYSPDGNFPPTTRGFIGFRFEAGQALSGEGAGDSQPQGAQSDVHFGYADVEVSGDGTNGHTATIHNMWYESEPNMPITIPMGEPEPERQAIAVPVGGAVPLGLLLFAAGAMALRRRSRANA